MLIEEIRDMDKNFEAEKESVEKSFYSFMTDIEDQRQVLARKEEILFHRKKENSELQEIFCKKEKELLGLQKIASKLNKDLAEMKSIEPRCSSVSNVLYPCSGDESQ